MWYYPASFIAMYSWTSVSPGGECCCYVVSFVKLNLFQMAYLWCQGWRKQWYYEYIPSNHSTNNVAHSRLFEQILDLYISIRNILHKYCKSLLPAKLRFRGLSRPSGLGLYYNKGESAKKDDCNNPPLQKSFIDMEEALLCPCRGCQVFFLHKDALHAWQLRGLQRRHKRKSDNSPTKINRSSILVSSDELSSQRENSNADDHLLNQISLMMNTPSTSMNLVIMDRVWVVCSFHNVWLEMEVVANNGEEY